MKWIKEILKGVIIGIANIIPGVSGGTMMVSMGIYDKIIGAVNQLLHHFIQSIKTLLPYGIGMILGIGGLSFCIEYLFKNFPLQTALLFIGLIFGGLPVILRKVKGNRINFLEGGLFLIFFALIIGMQLLKEGGNVELNLSIGLVLKLFLLGALTSAAMVVPGVSGSMILMSFGFYNPIIETINQFIRSTLDGKFLEMFHCVGILFPFGIGVLVGIFAIAKLIEYLLHRFERQTYIAILGIIIASPIAELMGNGIGRDGIVSVLTGVVTCGLGFIAAWM